ncbi:hypothetical protein [Bacillus thuringiensis]|uniref:hypothetical protein n=1 Tax=Bacillus thuringiensis TaxID=1428 RepID=UPI0032B03EB9
MFSNRTIYKDPKFFRKLIRLLEVQRILFRRKKGPSNWQKQRIKLTKNHEHIKKYQKVLLDKISTKIIKNQDIIGIENL